MTRFLLLSLFLALGASAQVPGPSSAFEGTVSLAADSGPDTEPSVGPSSVMVVDDHLVSLGRRDWEGILSLSGARIKGVTARYGFADRIGVDFGAEYDRESFDGVDEADSYLYLLAGLYYELCAHPRYRGYVRPFVGYESRTSGGTSSTTNDDIFGGVTLGGDVRLSENILLGLQSGVKYSAGDNSNKIWAGLYPRANLTARFQAE